MLVGSLPRSVQGPALAPATGWILIKGERADKVAFGSLSAASRRPAAASPRGPRLPARPLPCPLEHGLRSFRINK